MMSLRFDFSFRVELLPDHVYKDRLMDYFPIIKAINKQGNNFLKGKVDI